MTAPTTSAEQARAQLHRQVSAAADVAASGWRHPGHWELHHTALPADGPGDFTPYREPEYAEQGQWPFGGWLEALAEVSGSDRAQIIRQRGLEAGE